MDILEFRSIVVAEKPCDAGLAWLDGWIKKNPGKDTTAFFAWAAGKQGKAAANKLIRTPFMALEPATSWLFWVFWDCLDWSEAEKTQVPYAPKAYDPKARKIREYWTHKLRQKHIWLMDANDLAEALIRAFED